MTHLLQELLSSSGFYRGGFSNKPVNIYGPNFIAVRRQDMPEPTYEYGRGNNVQYTIDKPFRDFTPVRSEKDVEYFGNQFYAAPLKLFYRADAEGNILGPLVP